VAWLNRQEGIEAISDHAHAVAPPLKGWQAWMLHSMEDADVVLCICGEEYKKGFEKRGGGLGTTWEGAIATIDLYHSQNNRKYFPILVQPGAHFFVPKLLQPWNNDIALTEREKIRALIQHTRTKAPQAWGDKAPAPPGTLGDLPQEDDANKKALLHAQTVSKLIFDHGEAGNFLEAHKLLGSMAGLGDTPELVFHRAQAASGLVIHQGNAKRLQEARALLHSMAALGDAPEIRLLRAKAAFNLIDNYDNPGQLPQAQQQFEAMAQLGDAPEIAAWRASAACKLMGYYGEAGNLSKAHKLLDDMARLGNTPKLRLLRANAACSLIFYYGHAEHFLQARKLLDEMAKPGEMPVLLSKTMGQLIAGYAKAEKLPEAYQLLEEMAQLDNTPQTALFRAQAMAALIPYRDPRVYDAQQNLYKERQLLDAMAKLGDTPEIARCRAEASFHMIVRYCALGNLPEAQKLFEDMVVLGDTWEILYFRNRAAEAIRDMCVPEHSKFEWLSSLFPLLGFVSFAFVMLYMLYTFFWRS